MILWVRQITDSAWDLQKSPHYSFMPATNHPIYPLQTSHSTKSQYHLPSSSSFFSVDRHHFNLPHASLQLVFIFWRHRKVPILTLFSFFEIWITLLLLVLILQEQFKLLFYCVFSFLDYFSLKSNYFLLYFSILKIWSVYSTLVLFIVHGWKAWLR